MSTIPTMKAALADPWDYSVEFSAILGCWLLNMIESEVSATITKAEAMAFVAEVERLQASRRSVRRWRSSAQFSSHKQFATALSRGFVSVTLRSKSAAGDAIKTMSKITMSSPSSDGLFVIHKATAFIRGRERKTRTLQFITSDGFIGESRRHDRTEARHAALAKRAASISSAVALPKSPVNAAAMLPHNLDDSTLINVLLRRGFDVTVPTLQDNAIRSANDRRMAELDAIA